MRLLWSQRSAIAVSVFYTQLTTLTQRLLRLFFGPLRSKQPLRQRSVFVFPTGDPSG